MVRPGRVGRDRGGDRPPRWAPGRAPELQQQVGHPIIDADGHLVELGPVLDDELLAYLEEAGGRAVARPLPGQRGQAVRHLHRAGRPRGSRRAARSGGRCRRGGDGRRATRSTAPPPICPGCCTSAWTRWASTSPCSIPPTVLGLLDIDDVELGGGAGARPPIVGWPASSALTGTGWRSARIIPMSTPQVGDRRAASMPSGNWG